MKEAATIKFNELETNEEAVAVVRYNESSVSICLSMKIGGDVETVMTKQDAKRLLQALETAVD